MEIKVRCQCFIKILGLNLIYSDFIESHSVLVLFFCPSALLLLFCPSLQLFSVIPPQFLPNIKSPCWYEEVSGEVRADPYKKNRFCLRSKSFRNTCDRLGASFHQHLSHKDGKQFRLRCLPYFYIIGQPKCGTTDLFHRLLMHPEVKFNSIKEPHWWTRKRFGKNEVRLLIVLNYTLLPLHYSILIKNGQ